MKPAPFDMLHPATLPDAVAAMARDEAKIIAGGQSLGPMMNLRLARPALVVDVTALPGLTDIRDTPQGIEIGAAVTHARIEDGEVPEPVPGLLASVAGGIAYRAVRNRGTIGGSLCHADPAADWVTVLTALGATAIVARGDGANREIAMRDFILGAYLTALQPDEMLRLIRIPRYSAQVRWGYDKLCRKVGEFADAMAAVLIDPDRRICRVVLGALGGAPHVSASLARHIATTGTPPAIAEIKAALPDACAVKSHQLAVALNRAATKALAHD